MQYYEVSPIGVVRRDAGTFTYHSEETLEPGHIVEVPVGKKQHVGIVVAAAARPSYDTKPVTRLIEPAPLPAALVALAQWMASYYSTHPGIVWQTLLPRGLTKNRRSRPAQEVPASIRERTQFLLNSAQQTAVDTITAMSPGTMLLHGVTGSGKTAVYIEAARHTIANGKSVIVLTPEIGLTPQVLDEFSQHFEHLIVTHSRQTEAERHLLWRQCLTATTPHIIIGPRSALFMPLAELGLIVIDEMHEPSFKQEQSPRYSALRAASILAAQHQARVILGSATPPVSDYYLAEHSGRPIAALPARARAAREPEITVVDMTKRSDFTQHRFLSNTLLTRLEETFASGNQALIFHNRRGSASVTLCETCGWQVGCPRCFIPLTLHADHHELRCHICGFTDRVPTSCPSCSGADIIHKGIGTKLIESELRRIFPGKRIVRFDGDSSESDNIAAQYEALYTGAIDLIIGTQVVAKGLDLPHLRTVGVVQADAGLSLPDFSSSERAFQLLSQAIGRVGRNEHASTVIVQSYQPSHPAVVYGINQDYVSFYEYILKERRRASFPPFCYLLKLTCVYKTEAAAIRNAQQLARELRTHLQPTTILLGPTPAFYERQADTYRWQLVLKSPSRSDLQTLLTHVPPQHWQFELDPISLL